MKLTEFLQKSNKIKNIIIRRNTDMFGDSWTDIEIETDKGRLLINGYQGDNIPFYFIEYYEPEPE